MKQTGSYLDLAELILQGLREQQRDIEQLKQAAAQQDNFNAQLVERIAKLEQQTKQTEKKEEAKIKKEENYSGKRILSDEEIERLLRAGGRNIYELPKILFTLERF